MLACLSPNGMNRYDGASAPDDSRASVVTPLEVATSNRSGALAPS